jgi:KDO2-lipid IV(A) lauroyltransferase
LRRAGTQSAVRAALRVSRRLGPAGAVRLGAALGTAARWALPLRRRLAATLRRAGVEPTRARLDRYFEHFGWWAGWSLAVHQFGFDAAGMAERFTFDSSVVHLDRAVAAGRGVLLVGPHVFCHEIGVAAMHRRHPLVMLVRQSKSPDREALKQRWYEATGLDTIRRPRHASVVSDTRTFLRLLRAGRLMAIAPDLLAEHGHGVPVRVFGRELHVPAGPAVLAMRSGAAIVSAFADFSAGRIQLSFSEPEYVTADGDKAAAVSAAMTRLWGRLEAYLTSAPESWMFWLDKRWQRALRTTEAA